jgi:tetratricopeptide (TPR) repeat protein
MSNITDKFSAQHSACSPAALELYEGAVRDFAGHKPFLSHLQAALKLEPDMPAALALGGLANALMGRAQGMLAARAASVSTNAALNAVGGGTPHERVLARALEVASAGRWKRAAHHLEQHLRDHPGHLLAIKLAHALRFMTGEVAQMLRTTAAVMPSWSSSTPGYGFVLGCRAFALEETGEFAEAETAGRTAVAHEPDDVWGLHAVAHVMEMSGRTREGRAWLVAARPRWGTCGSFGQHLLWHLALFHLSEGDSDGALALYDAGLQPAREGDFRDFANAASLLWRLQHEGIDVGSRWDGLHEIAHERRRDCTYALASLHYLMALIASGDDQAARECMDQMRQCSRGDGNDQASVLACIGVPLAEVLLSAFGRGDRPRELGRLAGDLPRLGGSRAQQDVFLRTLMTLASAAGDMTAFAALAAIRRKQREEDRFQAGIARQAGRRRHFVLHGVELGLREAS